MKIWVAAAPLLLLSLWVAYRAVRGDLSRRSANVAVALVLLVYTVTTAALGVFWVARMDLPVFDWHYLFGYGLLVVLAAHVALQVAGLAAHFRRRSPTWLLEPEGRRFRRSVRLVGFAALVVVAGAPVLAWVVGRIRPSDRVRSHVGAPAASSGASAGERSAVWIERGGRRMSVPEYLWSESRHTRFGVLRPPGVTPARPPSVRPTPGAPRLPLPAGDRPEPRAPVDDAARIVTGARHALDARRIAELLHHTYGATRRLSDDLPFRAAASAGALYPTDVFLVVRAEGAVPAGVHYYDPEDHALATVGDGAAAERALAALPRGSVAARAPLVVVFGSTFDRSAFKYDTRSYRYVGLDAGHAAENLLTAGAALGLPCVLEPWFDDVTLSAAVGLGADGEGAVLVAGCGSDERTRVRGAPPAHAPPELPELADRVELTRLSHTLTSWRLAPGEEGSPRGLEVPVPDREPRYSDPLGLIRARRSFRAFSPSAVARADLDGVLEAARAALPALGRPVLVDVLVSVRAVEGLRPGAYRSAESLSLVTERADVASAVQEAGLDQEVVGRGAFVLALGMRPEAGEVDGPRDFRHALVQAGLAGGAVYLEATSRGLGVCSVGAFFDDELGDLLGASGERPKVLLLVAVGKR